ncbi:hypothetical protein V6N11_038523 [Hibiscus sabdariffa]|uniref:Uncharacterized protein n=1 Tax=Hibiscus sabdariffa TaxID=183260 RepID=A0ABR2SKH0_9ROSI
MNSTSQRSNNNARLSREGECIRKGGGGYAIDDTCRYLTGPQIICHENWEKNYFKAETSNGSINLLSLCQILLPRIMEGS